MAVDDLRDQLRATVEGFGDPFLRELVMTCCVNRDLFLKMPAAKSFHHAYNAGLLEHVWSLTKVCGFLADHYAAYFPTQSAAEQGPGARRGDRPRHRQARRADVRPVRVELFDRRPADRPRRHRPRHGPRAARRVEGFPEETLLLLEHAILAHHGRIDWGSPVVPKTIEALLVSLADDLDAKINAAARARLLSRTEGPFTDPVKPLEGRSLYKGIPVETPVDGAGSTGRPDGRGRSSTAGSATTPEPGASCPCAAHCAVGRSRRIGFLGTADEAPKVELYHSPNCRCYARPGIARRRPGPGVTGPAVVTAPPGPAAGTGTDVRTSARGTIMSPARPPTAERPTISDPMRPSPPETRTAPASSRSRIVG